MHCKHTKRTEKVGKEVVVGVPAHNFKQVSHFMTVCFVSPCFYFFIVVLPCWCNVCVLLFIFVVFECILQVHMCAYICLYIYTRFICL